MARQAKIVLVGGPTSATDRLVAGLRAQSMEVDSMERPEHARDLAPPDVVLIDATAGGGQTGDHAVADAVRDCREVWPEGTTAVLVVGSPDPATSAAAIDAGATDSVADAVGGPLTAAHVRRMLRAGDTLRTLLDDERRRAKQESLALAAAGVAVPLGAMLDELEAVMARAPVDEHLDDLLELTGRAVDAVDRLRRLATSSEFPVAEHDGV